MRTYGIRGWMIASLAIVIAFIFSACNTTKFVPQDQCLLNKARVKCVDDKTVATGKLSNYLRQKQNTEILGFWKLQLHIYNTAPLDTTTASNKYDESLTKVSMQQLRQQMNNMGYFQAEVDTIKVVKNRKVNLTYLVTAHKPYTICNYEVDIDIAQVSKIASDENCLIHAGEQFSTETLDAERDRITTVMRNRGYFYFEKSMLEFTADSSYNRHEVSVRIHLAPYVEHLDAESLQRMLTRYTIRRTRA